MEQDAGEKIQVKPEGSPLIFQCLPDGIIQVKPNQQIEHIGAWRINNKGNQSPDLPPQNHGRVQAQPGLIKAYCKNLQYPSHRIEDDNIIH